jgi:hypothetical protein
LGCGYEIVDDVVRKLKRDDKVKYECSERTYESKCLVSCNDGVEGYGAHTEFTCKSSGVWTGKAPDCREINKESLKLLKGVHFLDGPRNLNIFSLEKTKLNVQRNCKDAVFCPYWMKKPEPATFSKYTHKYEKIATTEGLAEHLMSSNSQKFEASGTIAKLKGLKLGATLKREASTENVHNWLETGDSEVLEIENEHPLFHTELDLNEVTLDKGFINDVKNLPAWDSWSENLQDFGWFFDLYGTHVYGTVKYGGSFKIFQRFDAYSLDEQKIDIEKEAMCVGLNIGIPKVFDATSKNCNERSSSYMKSQSRMSNSNNRAVEVNGGDANQFKNALMHTNNLEDSFVEWEETVRHNPAIIDFNSIPIWSIVRLRKDKIGVSAKKAADLENAFRAYAVDYVERNSATQFNVVLVVLISIIAILL